MKGIRAAEDDMDFVQITKIRMREWVRRSLEESAAANKRSMTSEIVLRLEQSFTGKPRYRVKMGRAA